MNLIDANSMTYALDLTETTVDENLTIPSSCQIHVSRVTMP